MLRYKYETRRYPMLPCDMLHYVTLRYAYRVLASKSSAIIDMSYICTALLSARNAHLLSTPTLRADSDGRYSPQRTIKKGIYLWSAAGGVARYTHTHVVNNPLLTPPILFCRVSSSKRSCVKREKGPCASDKSPSKQCNAPNQEPATSSERGKCWRQRRCPWRTATPTWSG